MFFGEVPVTLRISYLSVQLLKRKECGPREDGKTRKGDEVGRELLHELGQTLPPSSGHSLATRHVLLSDDSSSYDLDLACGCL